jgi:hypothetical protein
MALVFASGAALGVFGERYYVAREAEQNKGKGTTRRGFNQEEFRKQYLSSCS